MPLRKPRIAGDALRFVSASDDMRGRGRFLESASQPSRDGDGGFILGPDG
jgi:hypothetical protein